MLILHKDLCVTAALEAVNDSILRSSNTSIHPTTEHQDHAISNDPLRVINMAHIRRAYDLVTPSFSPEANAELYKWHAKHSSSSIITDGAHQEQDIEDSDDKNERDDLQFADFLNTMSAIRNASQNATRGNSK